MAKTAFTDGNPSEGVQGTIVDAAFLNLIFNHRHDGMNQDGSAPMDYGIDTGAANAYAVAYSPAITAVNEGMVLRFIAANTNTGPSTFTPAPGIIAPANIIGQGNGALQRQEIIAGYDVEVIWLGEVWRLRSSLGQLQVPDAISSLHAVNLETMQAAIAAINAITLAQFANSLLASGYQKFPGGLIIQWGSPDISSGSSGTLNFPIAFPNVCFFCVAINTGIDDVIVNCNPATISTTSFGWNVPGGVVPGNFSWFALGY